MHLNVTIQLLSGKWVRPILHMIIIKYTYIIT